MALGTVGKYERLDVLGHGASGIVYLARDTLLRRQVAIKEISAQGEERERFLEEARVLDRLRHPNIVEVHNVDTIGGKIVIDMEYVEGDNLLEILRDSNGPLPIEQAVSIAAQICDGLAYAQERHIVHRDIKPANILVSRAGQVKLVDFGLAQVLGTNSFVGGAGTYAYMAPEDFGEYEASDAQSDLWAVGVILYEMLTGSRPFSVARPKDPFAWKRAIETEPIAPPSTLRPEIPRDISDICLAALARDRAQRYASASEMSTDLREAQTSDLLNPQPVIAAQTSETRGRTIPLADELHTVIAHSDTSAPPMLLGASDIDGFLAAAPEPDHWDAARSALVTGRLSRWLEAMGEKPLASVAMDAEREARQESTGDAERDLLLRDFLYRAGLDTAVEARRAASAGSSFLKAGALEDAVAWLTQAVRLDSSHASYFLQLHKAYAAAGDAASATGVLERGLAAHPKDRTLRREAARLHQEIPRVTPTSVDLGILRHGEEARASFVVQAAASESGVLQGRIASLPVWLAATPMTFTTRRRQRIDSHRLHHRSLGAGARLLRHHRNRDLRRSAQRGRRSACQAPPPQLRRNSRLVRPTARFIAWPAARRRGRHHPPPARSDASALLRARHARLRPAAVRVRKNLRGGLGGTHRALGCLRRSAARPARSLPGLGKRHRPDRSQPGRLRPPARTPSAGARRRHAARSENLGTLASLGRSGRAGGLRGHSRPVASKRKAAGLLLSNCP